MDNPLQPPTPPVPVAPPAPQQEEAPVKPTKAQGELNKDIEKQFHTEIEDSKRHIRTFYPTWKRSVELRMGHPTVVTASDLDTDEGQSEINPDWSLTKAKTANLYSQVPVVQLTHENQQYAAAIPPFARALNYELGEKRSNVGVAMREVLNDVVNAAGIGAIIVGYAARFDKVEVPEMDSLPGPNGPMPVSQIPPELLKIITTKAKESGIDIPMKTIDRLVDDKFFCTRISPMDILTPKEFIGSCFDDANWVGYRGRMSWAEAKNEFDLDDKDKDTVLVGYDVYDTGHQNNLRSDSTQHDSVIEARIVKFDTIFYWRYRVDPDEKSFRSIWRLVYVHGKTEPVKHEAWKGQEYNEQTRKYVGACKFPLRILTLTYITDNPIPPSDSAAGRPQVNDMRRSRSQMFKNRERSIPIRWADTNRMDPLVMDLINKGEWQGFIPTNGDGARSIGEIARASYPSEDMSFDRAAKDDLMETWRLGPNQMGMLSSSGKTASETQTTQQNFSVGISEERGQVSAFFLGVVEVLAGWMALYSDFPNLSDQEKQQMQQAWDSKHILHDLVMTIRPDSTIVLDSQQRIQRLMQFLNMTAKSGYINPQPIISEIAELSGVDPSKVMIQPQPHVEEPNISYRFSGKDDLINPMVVALLISKNMAPTADQIQQAMTLLHAAGGDQPPQQPGMPPGSPGQPPGQSQPPPGAQPPPPHPPMPQQHPIAGPPTPAQPAIHPSSIGSPHEDWHLAPHVAKRSRDIGGE